MALPALIAVKLFGSSLRPAVLLATLQPVTLESLTSVPHPFSPIPNVRLAEMDDGLAELDETAGGGWPIG
jgi:hypothetical protein